MAYKLVISPTAGEQLAQIIRQYPYPGLLVAIAEQLETLAAHPSRIRSRSPSLFGRPWILLKHEADEVQLYFQVFYRFVPGEESLEITGISSLALQCQQAGPSTPRRPSGFLRNVIRCDRAEKRLA